jgi:hypothetical protein
MEAQQNPNEPGKPNVPGHKAVDNKKNARDRNASANSVNVRSKAAVAARNVVAASKATDKPGCIRLISGGRRLPPFCSTVLWLLCDQVR